MNIYFYGVLSPDVPANTVLNTTGVWVNSQVQPGVASVPYTTSNSLGAYAVYNPATPGAAQVRV